MIISIADFRFARESEVQKTVAKHSSLDIGCVDSSTAFVGGISSGNPGIMTSLESQSLHKKRMADSGDWKEWR
jgi:hypothetical protein